MFYRSCSRSFRVSDSFFLSRRTVRFFSRSSRSFCSLSVSTFCSSGFFRLLASSRSNRDVNFSSSFSHSSCWLQIHSRKNKPLVVTVLYHLILNTRLKVKIFRPLVFFSYRPSLVDGGIAEFGHKYISRRREENVNWTNVTKWADGATIDGNRHDETTARHHFLVVVFICIFWNVKTDRHIERRRW